MAVNMDPGCYFITMTCATVRRPSYGGRARCARRGATARSSSSERVDEDALRAGAPSAGAARGIILCDLLPSGKALASSQKIGGRRRTNARERGAGSGQLASLLDHPCARQRGREAAMPLVLLAATLLAHSTATNTTTTPRRLQFSPRLAKQRQQFPREGSGRARSRRRRGRPSSAGRAVVKKPPPPPPKGERYDANKPPRRPGLLSGGPARRGVSGRYLQRMAVFALMPTRAGPRVLLRAQPHAT